MGDDGRLIALNLEKHKARGANQSVPGQIARQAFGPHALWSDEAPRLGHDRTRPALAPASG